MNESPAPMVSITVTGSGVSCKTFIMVLMYWGG